MTAEKNQEKEYKQSLLDLPLDKGEKKQEESFERIIVKDDTYFSKLELIDISKTNYEDAKTKKSKERINFVFYFLVGDKKLPFFVTAKVFELPKDLKNTNKQYSNSKLFDLLVDLELIQEYNSRKDSIRSNGDLMMFLSEKMASRTFKISTATVNKGTDRAYSKVDRIFSFANEEGKKAK